MTQGVVSGLGVDAEAMWSLAYANAGQQAAVVRRGVSPITPPHQCGDTESSIASPHPTLRCSHGDKYPGQSLTN
jgi:hypothetical protein